MPARLPTPPSAQPPLVLCADGGGSKVCVVIRSPDGLEVRATAGPCNVQSVGHAPAIQTILLATYRALSLLPTTHLPADFVIPAFPEHQPQLPTKIHPAKVNGHINLAAVPPPGSPFASRPGSPTRAPKLPPIHHPIFQNVWLALAGISTPLDSKAFMPYVTNALGVDEERVKITNDVNLLAAPSLDSDVDHVLGVVCGTGTVGRTIKVDRGDRKGKLKTLPLEDLGVSRGWGYVLCDEGSAFWIGRLAIRSLLTYADRTLSAGIYSSPAPSLLPFHKDLLEYFGTNEPMELIDLTSLTGPIAEGLGTGEATAKRNAFVAGAARVVFKWAFPDDDTDSPPSPTSTNGSTSDPVEASHKEALSLAQRSIVPLIELTLSLLGDGTVVKPDRTALSLGGGLWNSKGYKSLLSQGLRKEGVVFKEMRMVKDAAGEGAKGLAMVEFGE